MDGRTYFYGDPVPLVRLLLFAINISCLTNICRGVADKIS